MPYWIEYSPDAEDHLRRLKAYRQSIVLDKVEEPLRYQPTVETKHRKLMRPNPLAPWELRIGDLRVYYDVEEEPKPQVNIRAIGLKVGNRVYIGNQEIPL